MSLPTLFTPLRDFGRTPVFESRSRSIVKAWKNLIEPNVRAKPFVVVGIPAFNEEKTIAQVVLKSQRYADVVVVCDDGSSDLTCEIAKRLGADVVRHTANSGYGAAMKSLFKRAWELGTDVFVTLDADGQHEPDEIPNVLKPITDGVADIVIGSRFVNGRSDAKEMPSYRQFGAKVITKLVNGRTKNGITDAQSGFRAYGKRAVEHLTLVEAGMGASVEILLEANRQGLRICEVPGSCRYRKGDVSTSKRHPVVHGAGVVMSVVRLVVEERPLAFLGVPGLACLVAGISFGVFLLQIYAIAHAINTNVALASLGFLVIGFFMLSLAITLYSISRISKKINGKKQ